MLEMLSESGCAQLYTLSLKVAALRSRRTSRVSQPSKSCIEVMLENCEYSEQTNLIAQCWIASNASMCCFSKRFQAADECPIRGLTRELYAWVLTYWLLPEKFLRSRPSIFIALSLTDFTRKSHYRLSCIKTPRYLWQEIDPSGLLQNL